LYNFKKPKLPAWYDISEELARVNQWEARLLQLLEKENDPSQIVHIQQDLNKLAYAKMKARQIEEDFTDV